MLASFNVEQFGTERVASLTEDEISERYDALRAMTHFELSRLTPSERRPELRGGSPTSAAASRTRPTEIAFSAPSSGAAIAAAVSSRVVPSASRCSTAHRDGAAPQLAHRGREPALRHAEPEAGRR